MKNKLLRVLFDTMILLGVALGVMSWVYYRQQQLLGEAEVLATEGKFAEALNAYRKADTQYTQTFLGIPQGPILNVLDRLGVETRSYIQLRLAEMEFREGERLLALYGPVQLVSSNVPITNPLDKDRTDKPSIEEVMKHFNAAENQYKQIQEQTRNPYWQFVATVNGVRAIVPTFLVKDFLEKQPRNSSSLRQGLVYAVKSLQRTLQALYADQVRASLADELNAVLLLETLTRFQQNPEIEERERKQIEGILKDALTMPEIEPLGEMLKKGNLESKSLSPEEENTMKEFLLDKNKSPNVISEQGSRPPDTSGSKAGPGSADAGSEGQLH